jgi:P-type Ca2+ transporter type 2C
MKQCGHQVILAKQDERVNDKIRLAAIPFDSKYKMSFAAIKSQTDGNLVRIYGKGAPDFLLKYCETVIDYQGQKQVLNDQDKTKIIDDLIKNKYAKKCLRTILTAYKDVTVEEFNKIMDEVKDKDIHGKIDVFAKGMSMIALYGLKDPLKDGVIIAIS